jgi:hypothetical protein
MRHHRTTAAGPLNTRRAGVPSAESISRKSSFAQGSGGRGSKGIHLPLRIGLSTQELMSSLSPLFASIDVGITFVCRSEGVAWIYGCPRIFILTIRSYLSLLYRRGPSIGRVSNRLRDRPAKSQVGDVKRLANDHSRFAREDHWEFPLTIIILELMRRGVHRAALALCN